MRVQFTPWQKCSTAIAIREGVDRDSTSTPKKRNERKGNSVSSSGVTVKRDFKEYPPLSLCCRMKGHQKKRNQKLFQPLFCLTQPHAICLIGSNVNDNDSYYEHEKHDNEKQQAASGDLVVSNRYSWISKPGKFYSFLPQDVKQAFIDVPAVFSSSGDLVAAYQHNNTVVSIWDAKLNTSGPSDDSNRLKLPKNLHGTSLQFVDDAWLIGSVNDGSLFLVDCRGNPRDLVVIPTYPESGNYQDSLVICSISPMSPSEQVLYVHLITQRKKNKGRQNALVLQTFSISLSSDKTEAAARTKIIRTDILPFTSLSQNQGITESTFQTLPQDIQVHAACTLKPGSTIAVLTQTERNYGCYNVHVLDIASGNMNMLPTVSIPSLGPSERCSEDTCNNNVSIGCVSPDHIALVCHQTLAILDLRYNGAIIYETNAIQIFEAAVKNRAISMKIVLSDSSSHSLAVAAFDCDQCTMTLAYSTFAILGQRITMADALVSSISTSQTGINFTSNFCSDRPSTLKLQKDRIINYCNDFIGCTVKQPLSTRDTLVVPEWESLFEEALIEIEQSFENTELVKLIETATTENCSKMNGGNHHGANVRKLEGSTSLQRPSLKNCNDDIRDFLVCAAYGSIRIMIHEYYDGAKASSPCNGNTRSVSNFTNNLHYSIARNAAVKVFVKCCSLTKLSLRQINQIFMADTKNSCSSFVQFLCQASLLELLHFTLANCTEVSESDLVLALSYIICVVPVNDLMQFYCSRVVKLPDSSVTATCNGESTVPYENVMTQDTSLDSIFQCISTSTVHDGLLQKVVTYSKEYSSRSHDSSVLSRIKTKMLFYSRLYWTRFIVCTCDTNLNPSLLRSAIIRGLVMPLRLRKCCAQKHLELILLSTTALLQQAVEGRKLVLLSQSEHKRIVEWVEALVDALQFCIVTDNQKSSSYSWNDRTLNQVQNTLNDATKILKGLKAVDDVISCSMTYLLQGGKRRRSDNNVDEVVSSKRIDNAFRSIPSYSIERIRF